MSLERALDNLSKTIDEHTKALEPFKNIGEFLNSQDGKDLINSIKTLGDHLGKLETIGVGCLCKKPERTLPMPSGFTKREKYGDEIESVTINDRKFEVATGEIVEQPKDENISPTLAEIAKLAEEAISKGLDPKKLDDYIASLGCEKITDLILNERMLVNGFIGGFLMKIKNEQPKTETPPTAEELQKLAEEALTKGVKRKEIKAHIVSLGGAKITDLNDENRMSLKKYLEKIIKEGDAK